MKLNNLINSPCAKCPYTLGLVQTLVSPCPQCKENGYQAYERFRQEKYGEDKPQTGE